MKLYKMLKDIEWNHLLIMSVLAGLLILSCGKKEIPQPSEKIMVKIGDRTISVGEFLRRAEYTVRPPYCDNNTNLDKQIALNSLIAEKLMAMEAGDTNRFITSDRIQAYLQGRKEQSMRQVLYEQEALNKVELDTFQLKRIFKVAGRKYKISFINLPDSNLVKLFKHEMRTNNKSFEDIYLEMTGLDTLPQREVEWSGNENDLLIDSLYFGKLEKNQVVGPVKMDKNQYLLLKVNGWIDRPVVSEMMIQERWRNIKDEYSERTATKIYDEYIIDMMKDKKIEFYPEVFFKIANLLGPIYIKSDAEKEAMLKNTFWDQDGNIEKYQDLQTQIEALYQEPLFKVGDEVWKVKDFADELRVHPLVFRNRNMKKNEFGQQLQFAIMDMIRDKYLTKEAYKRGYDKINIIQRQVNMWRDNFNYQYFRAQYLHRLLPDSILAEMKYMPTIEKYLNPKVDSLQIKYSDIIEVDIDAFNDIQLTRIEMNVIQENVPFPSVVPPFPLVTTDHTLDYGRKMD